MAAHGHAGYSTIMLSVVIPTYRERDNIEPLLARLAAVRPQLAEPLEVLIVDNGSDDGTAACARRAMARWDLGRVIEHAGGRDLAQAVSDGIQQARGDLIGVMDADLSHPPELLPALVRAVRAGREMAIASRYVAGGGIADWPWTRRALSSLGNLLARPLVPVKDATSGFFVCRGERLRAVTLRSRGFKILLEILVTGGIRQVEEVPYVFTDRRAGSSKLSGRVLWRYVDQLGRLYRYRAAH